jgi:cell division protein FtsL
LLIAQKRYDDYEELAQFDRVEKQKVKVREVTVTKRNSLRKFKAICAIMIMLGLSLFILHRYTLVNEYNQKIRKLKTELSKVQKANSQLQVEMDRKIDLNQIEQLAIQKLGMQYPNKTQTILLQVKKKDFTELPQEANKNTNVTDGVLGTVSQGLSQLVSYIN